MNNDIRKIIDDNWEDIKALVIEKVEAEQKLKTIWDLKTKDGEEYYRLYSNGGIVLTDFSSSIDRLFRYMSNAFLTIEEVEFMRERRKIEAVMRKYSRPFKYEERNYYIEYQYDRDMPVISVYYYINMGIPYFESEEIVQKAIDEIGEDRLKKYWFGVEE